MTQVSSIKSATFPVNGKWHGPNEYRVQPIKQHPAEDNDYNTFLAMFNTDQEQLGHEYDIHCKWEPFREQILQQWPRLSRNEVDAAGPNRSYLSALISIKYNVDRRIIGNYLSNMERHLPLM